jgi:hypothetical protein
MFQQLAGTEQTGLYCVYWFFIGGCARGASRQLPRLSHSHQSHRLDHLRIRENGGFEFRNCIDFLFEIANRVNAKADAQPVPALVG